MKSPRSGLVIGLAALASSVCLAFAQTEVTLATTGSVEAVASQPGEAAPAGDGISISLSTSNGKSAKVRSARGGMSLAGVKPGQTVDVEVRLGAQNVGYTVEATAPNGGRVIGTNLTADRDGIVRLKFKAGDEPGAYQLAIVFAGYEVAAHFWAVDSQTPEKNPPSVDLRD